MGTPLVSTARENVIANMVRSVQPTLDVVSALLGGLVPSVIKVIPSLSLRARVNLTFSVRQRFLVCIVVCAISMNCAISSAPEAP